MLFRSEFAGTFAKGLVFQENPKTHDRRISGSAASLAGLEQALEQQNPDLVDLSVQRLLMTHAIVFSFGGVPLLYMGDELALLNDHSFLTNPEMAMDNRWVHRPAMPWELPSQLEQPSTLQQQAQAQVQKGMKQIIEARVRTPHLHAAIESTVLESPNTHIFAFERQHPLGRLLCLFNFSEEHQAVPAWWLGFVQAKDLITLKSVYVEAGMLWLAPYQYFWLGQE